MHRKLIITVVILLIAGLSFLAGVFSSTMLMAKSSVNSSARIDILALQKNGFLLEEFGETRLFILDSEAGLKVYMLPYYNNAFVMPDLAWFRWGGFCKKFAPETESGKLKEGGVFKCHDKSDYEWGKKEWVWDLEGKNMGDFTEDMYKPRFIVKEGYLVLQGMQK